MSAFDVISLEPPLNTVGTTAFAAVAPFVFIPPSATPPGPPAAPALTYNSSLTQLNAVDFGRDISTFPDLDASLQDTDDPRLLGEVILRRLTTPRGKLSFHPDYGTDIRQYLNDAMTDARRSQIKSDVELEVLQDERFESCVCSVTFINEVLRLSVLATTADGPFIFTIDVTQLTAVLVTAEEA